MSPSGDMLAGLLYDLCGESTLSSNTTNQSHSRNVGLFTKKTPHQAGFVLTVVVVLVSDFLFATCRDASKTKAKTEESQGVGFRDRREAGGDEIQRVDIVRGCELANLNGPVAHSQRAEAGSREQVSTDVRHAKCR